MKLKAKSKNIFTVSGKENPNKTNKFYGITKKTVKVRTWAGYRNKLLKKIPKGSTIAVCDSIKSKAGNTWYYIRHDGKYGFISATGAKEKAQSNADKFIKLLEKYSKYIKEHYSNFIYEYDSDIKTFGIAKRDIENGKNVHITCVSPVRWGLHDIGIRRDNGDSLIYGEDGHIQHFDGNAGKYLKLIKKGGPVGKTCKQAIDSGLLKKGDIPIFEGHTHTSVYSGSGYVFFDSGRTTFEHGLKNNGIKVSYYKEKRYQKDKIKEVLRWR